MPTLTEMYNVLAALRDGRPLTAGEAQLRIDADVDTLRGLHDALDLAVLDAYGWGDLAPLLAVAHGNMPPAHAAQPDMASARRALSDALLERLVALNHARAADEVEGLIRWLRPDYQIPLFEAEARRPPTGGAPDPAAQPVAAPARQIWPATLPEQVGTVARLLAESARPLTQTELAARISGRRPARLPLILDTLVSLGRAVRTPAGAYDCSCQVSLLHKK